MKNEKTGFGSWYGDWNATQFFITIYFLAFKKRVFKYFKNKSETFNT